MLQPEMTWVVRCSRSTILLSRGSMLPVFIWILGTYVPGTGSEEDFLEEPPRSMRFGAVRYTESRRLESRWVRKRLFGGIAVAPTILLLKIART
jgi:hypothetical protein